MKVIRQMVRDLQHYHDKNAVAIAPQKTHPCRPGTLIQLLRTVPSTTGLALLGIAGGALLWGVGAWLNGIVSIVKSSPAAPAVTRIPQRVQSAQTPVAPVKTERPAAAILAQPPTTTRLAAAPRSLPAVVPLPSTPPATVLPTVQNSAPEASIVLSALAEIKPVTAPLVATAIPEPETALPTVPVTAVSDNAAPLLVTSGAPILAHEPVAVVAPAAVVRTGPDEVVPPVVTATAETVMLATAPVPPQATVMAVTPATPVPIVLTIEPVARQNPPALIPRPAEKQIVAPKLPVTKTATPPTLNHFKEAERAYREGLAAYQANRTDASLVALQLAIGFYPGHLSARELLADQLELRGDFEAALALLEEGLTIAADYTAFRKRAARILLDRGEKAAAAQLLIGTGLVPLQTDRELHWLLANTYQQLGEYQLAARTYRNLLVHEPENGPLWFNLGSALETSGQHEEAYRAYQQGLKSGGLNREMTAWAKEFTATSLPAAVAIAPPPVLNHFMEAERAYQEGLAAYRVDRTDASLIALQLALGFYPGHLLARELLVDQLELRGEASQALALLEDGLTIAPDHTAFRKRVARLFADHGELARAAQVLIGSGLTPVRTDPELHRLLAATYRQLGEHFLAAQTYRNLLVHDRRNGTLWVNLGVALDASGQRDEARQAYQKALTVGGLSREEFIRARAGVRGAGSDV